MMARKLTDEQIEEIRKRRINWSRAASASVLAREFGVSQNTIYRVSSDERMKRTKDQQRKKAAGLRKDAEVNLKSWAVRRADTVRRRAQQCGVAFNLSYRDILDAYPVTGLCPVLGVEMQRVDRMDDWSPEIDRVDPSVGYEPDNIRVISRRANRIKSDATWKEVQAVADWMLMQDFDIRNFFPTKEENVHSL